MSLIASVLFLAVVTGLACSLPGGFLVLRRRSMLVDGVSHAVLPGVVVGFWLTHDFRSPLLIVGAALAGLVVVAGSEYLAHTGLIGGDASQGLVFPALFSLGIILISMKFGHIHLDAHSVLVGELNYVALDQIVVAGVPIGPRYAIVMAVVGLVNLACILACLPALEAATFDPGFATVRGLPVRWLATLIAFLTTVTVTAAFYAVGAVLVISLMIVPAATATLFARSMRELLLLSACFSALGACVGFWAAYVVDAPTSAGMAVGYGLLFAMALGASKLVDGSRGARGASGASVDCVGQPN